MGIASRRRWWALVVIGAGVGTVVALVLLKGRRRSAGSRRTS
jgi:cytochrome c-type biogenesis protein CcmE